MNPRLRKLLLSGSSNATSGGGTILFSSLGLLAGDPFTVAPGATVLVDLDTPSLGFTEIGGTVILQASRHLTTTGIHVASTGTIRGQTVGARQAGQITLTGAFDPTKITGSNSTLTNDGVSRGFNIDAGGQVDLWGTIPTTPWTQLDNHYTGGTTLTLKDAPAWPANDPIIVAHTDFVDEFSDTYTEQRTLAAPTSGTTATLSSALTKNRWGKLQYPLDTAVSGSAMSLTPGTFTQANPAVPTVLDERARVYNLNRGFIIDCPNDSDWSVKGHGVHIMWMGTSGVTFDGVQVRRGGQRGMLKRYPFHSHKASYRDNTATVTMTIANPCVVTQTAHGFSSRQPVQFSTTASLPTGVVAGTTYFVTVINSNSYHLSDSVDHYNSGTFLATSGTQLGTHSVLWQTFTQDSTAAVRNCVVWESSNRAFTIHATCGMTMNDNVGYDIKGHGGFFEDGSERRNNYFRNSILRVRPPVSTGKAYQGDALSGTFVSASGNGTTCTVNWTGHGLYSGQIISVYANESGFSYRRINVTVTDANHFTYPAPGSGSMTLSSFAGGITKDNNCIKNHDAGASGHWVTNMDNKIVDPYASDVVGPVNAGVYGSGVWCSIARIPFGATACLNLSPFTIDEDTFSGVTAHSCWNAGLNFAEDVTDEEGTFDGANKYNPVSGGFQSTDHVFWKNAQRGYKNIVAVPTYLRWTTADNGGLDFEGTTNVGGRSENHLSIGYSLNNAQPDPGTNARDPFYPRACFATYHGTVRFKDMNAVNFPYAQGIAAQYNNSVKQFGGGVTPGGSDFYDEPGISLTHGANTNIRMSNCHPGWMCPPLHLDGMPLENPLTSTAQVVANPPFSDLRHYSIAMVWQDLDGKYGAAGKFMLPFTATATALGGGRFQSVPTGVVDDYLLVGATNLANGPTTGTATCKTTDTRYYGLGWSDSMVNGTSDTIVTAMGGSSIQVVNRAPMTTTRQDPTTGATIGTPHVIIHGTASSDPFSGFHSTAIQKGGRYSIDFTDATKATSPRTIAAPTTYFRFDICNANLAGDYVVLGFPWANASHNPRVAFGHGNASNPENGQPGYTTFPDAADVTAGRAQILTTAGASVAAVYADTTGNTFWHDNTNNRLWVRWTAKPFTKLASTSYPDLYDIQTIYVAYP